MRVGVVMYGGDWVMVREAVRQADAGAIDAVGFWDHFHSVRPEDGPMITGWSTYGHLAAITRRIHLCPLVLDGPNYSIGVLGKESSMLAIMSEGRFELGIGVGDFPLEEEAWGLPRYPDAATRVTALEETVGALRRVWTGEQVSYEDEHVRLQGAGCRPFPHAPPRIVVGAGRSQRLVHSAVQYDDEINLYGDSAHLDFARREIESSSRRVALSACVDSWADWGEEPTRAADGLKAWKERGVDRLFVTVWAPYTFLLRLSDLVAAM